MSEKPYTDTVDKLIEEIHVELDRISGGQIPFEIGRLKIQENARPPRIVWDDEIDGSVDDAVIIGGNTGTIGTDIERFEVHIWQVDKKNARDTFHNLIRAARNKSYGPNVTVTAKRWETDGHLHHGRLLVVNIDLAIPIEITPQPTATVNSHGHTVTVSGEVVC